MTKGECAIRAMLAEKVAEVEAMKTTIASLETALAEERRGREARKPTSEQINRLRARYGLDPQESP